MRLQGWLAEWVPEGLCTWLEVIGGCVAVVGLVVSPFLPTSVGVIVINEISMVTLLIAALLGIDRARDRINSA